MQSIKNYINLLTIIISRENQENVLGEKIYSPISSATKFLVSQKIKSATASFSQLRIFSFTPNFSNSSQKVVLFLLRRGGSELGGDTDGREYGGFLLRGDTSERQGDTSGLRGAASGLREAASGLWGAADLPQYHMEFFKGGALKFKNQLKINKLT